MRKFNYFRLLLPLTLLTSTQVMAEPTRTFFTETSEIAAKDSVSIDLEYSFISLGTSTSIRLGKLAGEVLVNMSNTGFPGSSLGYKGALSDSLSVYGLISTVSAGTPSVSYTDVGLGVAYSVPFEDININLNGEFVTDDSNSVRGGDNTLFIKAAMQVPFTLDNSPASLIVEMVLENNDFLESGASFGVRWLPVPKLTTDFVFFVDNGSNDASGFPGYIKLNYMF